MKEKFKKEQISQVSDSKNDSDRLNFKESSGWYKYGRIPYKIWYSLNSPTDDKLNEKKPAMYKLTPDLSLDPKNKEKSLSIFIHESVPVEFKDVVILHELKEAEFRLVDNIDKEQAHEQAVIETEKYAKKHLSKEEFDKFIKWEETCNKE